MKELQSKIENQSYQKTQKNNNCSESLLKTTTAYSRCGRHETPWQVASVETPIAKSRHSKFKSKDTLQSSEKSI